MAPTRRRRLERGLARAGRRVRRWLVPNRCEHRWESSSVLHGWLVEYCSLCQAPRVVRRLVPAPLAPGDGPVDPYRR